MHVSSYPSIFTLGHRAVLHIFDGPVVIEEKVDGSQFSMGVIDGQLVCRSKGQQIVVDAPEKLFANAIATAKELAPLLLPGHIYRCEYLQKPKHNTLAYSRIPAKHLIVFDICKEGTECYLTPGQKKAEAERLGLECVPCFHYGPYQLDAVGELDKLFEVHSVLGGAKIEGIVLKNYDVFTPDKKIAVAKFVSDAFKEKHQGAWKAANPTKSDIVQGLITGLRTEARWNKAIQHLREAGKITDTPSDIGPLIKEIQADVKREEEDQIKETLFTHFWPQIARGIIAGFPEAYKARVMHDYTTQYATQEKCVEQGA
jgi:hypothetical protein